MTCTKCGSQLPQGSSFCPKCGWSVSAATPAAATTMSTSGDNAQPTSSFVTPLPTPSPIQKGFFNGRIGRLRYFEAHLIGMVPIAIVFGFLLLLVLVTNNADVPVPFFGTVILLLMVIGWVFSLVVTAALVIRRCHDLGHSAWFALLALIPLINAFFSLYLLFKKGEDSPNTYGPVPLYRPILQDTFNSGETILSDGQQKRVGKNGIIFIVICFLVIPLVGICASIVLVSLSDARHKAAEAIQASTGLPDGWQLFNAGDKFEIALPNIGTPTSNFETKTTNDGNSYNYNTYTAEGPAGAQFSMGIYDFKDPIDISDPDTLLKHLTNNFLTTEDGDTMATSSLGYTDSFRSLDFTINTNSGFIRGQYILINGNTILLLIDSYTSQNYSEQDYQTFINSLQVIQ